MNKYNPDIHHRRSIRLKGYDYSKQGLYFITACCQNKEHFFGEVVQESDTGATMLLNAAGKMVEAEWLALPDRFINIKLHEFIVMPNHFHGILEIVQVNASTETAANNKTVGDITGAFKSITTVEYSRGVKNMHWKPFDKKLWQRDYFEHIIRNEEAFDRIANYIINNPSKWHDDRFYR